MGFVQYFKRKQTELTFCNVTRGLRPSAYVLCVVSAGGISPPTPCLLAGVAYGFGEQGGVCAFLRLATRYEVVQSLFVAGVRISPRQPVAGETQLIKMNKVFPLPIWCLQSCGKRFSDFSATSTIGYLSAKMSVPPRACQGRLNTRNMLPYLLDEWCPIFQSALAFRLGACGVSKPLRRRNLLMSGLRPSCRLNNRTSEVGCRSLGSR